MAKRTEELEPEFCLYSLYDETKRDVVYRQGD